MSTLETKPPASRLWKYTRRFLITIAVLITLGAVLWVEENIRGKHAWTKYRRELEAKGEKLDYKDFIPPKVPDDQNFAMTPILAGLYELAPGGSSGPELSGFRNTNVMARASIITSKPNNPFPNHRSFNKGELTDLVAWASFFRGATNTAPELTRKDAAAEVLSGFKRYQPQMDEYLNASQRKYCRFNAGWDTDNPFDILLPHLSVVKQIALLFSIRGTAELASGDSQESFTDLKMVFYLSDACREPALISELVRIAIAQLGVRVVWEGLAEHNWTDAQLAELQARLRQFDFFADYHYTVRAECAGEALGLQKALGPSLMPKGWIYQNMAGIARMHYEWALPMINPTAHRVYPEKAISSAANSEKAAFSAFYPYRIFAQMLLPAFQESAQKFSVAQTQLDQALIACALERYRLKNGQLPESLESLKPQFIDVIPNDVINGQPMIYHRKDDAHFLLYSVGWNETDDGGKVVTPGKGENARPDLKQGDWVWPEYPAK